MDQRTEASLCWGLDKHLPRSKSHRERLPKQHWQEFQLTRVGVPEREEPFALCTVGSHYVESGTDKNAFLREIKG